MANAEQPQYQPDQRSSTLKEELDRLGSALNATPGAAERDIIARHQETVRASHLDAVPATRSDLEAVNAPPVASREEMDRIKAALKQQRQGESDAIAA